MRALNSVLMVLCLSAFSIPTYAADIASYFQAFEKESKGPFGPNMMQMRSKRISYNQWASSGGGFIFQSAFRNKVAQDLLREHGIYTGNLFATNYYELRAEALLGDANAANLSSDQGLEALVSASQGNPQVFVRAKQMVQNWNLEKLYIAKNPSSKLARSFALRGVAGAEFEMQYAQEFVDFFISVAPSETDFLLLARLVNASSLVESNNFTRIRDKATSLYETYGPGGSKGHTVSSQQVRQIKFIRDSIHNQLTPEIVGLIDNYLKQKSNPELVEIKNLILSYFSRGVADINYVAKKAKITPVALARIDKKSPALEDLVAYSQELLAVRNALPTDAVKLGEKYLGYAYTLTASAFLFQKVRTYIDQNAINGTNIGDLTVLIQNILYMEGMLASSSIVSASDVPADFDDYEVLYDDMLSEIMGNIKAAYEPYVEKWKEVDSHMDGMLDDTLRSSAISLFNHILDKMD